MTRIALVIRQLGLGGAEKQLCQLAAGLSRRGYKPLVIVLRTGGEKEEELRKHGVELTTLAGRGSLGIVRAIRLTQTLRSLRPDLVHGFDATGSIYCKIGGWLAGIPHVVGSVRFGGRPPRKVICLERALRSVASAVVSNSQVGKDVWMRHIGTPEKDIFVVPNGVWSEEMSRPPSGFLALRDLLKLPASDPIVGCIGTLYDLKNPLMFVRVAAAVIAARPATQFVWIGDGPMRSAVDDAINATDVRDRIHVVGRRADAAWLAQGVQIGVLTSLTEGLPNVIMEFMYWGKPVVTTDAGGCRELVGDGVTGFVVDRNDSASMAARIIDLLDDPATATALGARGRLHLEEQFSDEAMVSGMISVYEHVLRGRFSSIVADTARPCVE